MKKPSLSIYIPVYNEEQNIKDLILSLFKQQVKNFNLKKMYVITDGSTDKTEVIVNKLKIQFKKLDIITHKNNKGKLFRLNEIFKKNSSDILVILDGDIKIMNNNFLEKLISKIIENKNVVLTTAHSILDLPESIMGKFVASCFLTWDYVRLSIPNFDNVHNLSGQATAYRGSFVKKLSIPKSAYEERIYLYLMSKRANKNGFWYEKDAEYKFIPISTIKDFIELTNRPFGKKQKELDNMFKFNTEELLIVPTKYKIKGLINSFIHHPILTPVGVILNFILPRIALSKKNNNKSTWTRVPSTKRRFN